jgi:hypothetical protein
MISRKKWWTRKSEDEIEEDDEADRSGEGEHEDMPPVIW